MSLIKVIGKIKPKLDFEVYEIIYSFDDNEIAPIIVY